MALQAAVGTGYVSTHVFGAHPSQESPEQQADPADGKYFRMVTIKTTHVNALKSSTGLLMVSPFLPEHLKECVWCASCHLPCTETTSHAFIRGTMFAGARSAAARTRNQRLSVQFQLAASGRFSEHCLLKNYVYGRTSTRPFVTLFLCAVLASHASGSSTIVTCTHV